MAPRKPPSSLGKSAFPIPDSPNPIEIAIDETRADPSPESPARELLRNQNRLILVQLASERMGIVLKTLTGVAGVLAAAVLASLVWEAAHDRGLVIEAISTPPDFAERGLTGQVLATELLDQLAKMDGEAESLRRSASYSSSWSSDAKVEIPSTGVSVGELQRFLRSWLGHQTRISGEVVRIAPGKAGEARLAVTVRAGLEPGERIEGAEADIDALMKQAAEKLYRRTQPYRYFVYARNAGKMDEAEASLRGLVRVGDRPEQVWAWSGLANMLYGRMDLPAGEAAAHRALALDPDFAPALGNLTNIAATASHPETALPAARRAATLFTADRNLDPNAARLNGLWQQITALSLSGDAPGATTIAQRVIDYIIAQGVPATSPELTRNRNELALHLALSHRPLAAERAMTLPQGADGGDYQLAWIADRAERQDWAAVVASEAALPALCKGAAPYCERKVLPSIAHAVARNGDLPRAAAMAAALPADCYDCAITRGRIAALAGRYPEAERHFADAVRQAPSIPHAYLRWAEALMARGQPDAAIARLKTATIKAPRFADAHSLWGDALLAKGDAAGAARKFRQADLITPRWGRNHLLWGVALARQGHAAEARAEWLKARSLDLVPADRARLEDLLKGARP